MALDLTHPEIAFAVDTVREAALLARDVEAELVEPAMTKEDRSPVTVADFAVQALVGCLLDRAFPGTPLVGEEDSHDLRQPGAEATLQLVARFVGRKLAYATTQTVCEWIDHGNAEPAQRFWTLDPIDGTKGFLRGDQYAVALALIEGGQVTIGALGCPNLAAGYRSEPHGPGSLIVAARGHGAWLTPLEKEEWAPLRVSEVIDTKEARLLRSVEAGHTNVGRMGTLIELLKVEADPVLMDSQAKYSVLAAGRGDLLFRLLSRKQPDYREKIWDQAAGSIIVEEAGGRITDLLGNALDFTQGTTLAKNRGVLASNGTLHAAALQALSIAFEEMLPPEEKKG